jgi:hypothetical protein
MMTANLTIERERGWEAAAETELAISSAAAGAGTGGKTIYNHWDADVGHGFYVEIAAAQVGGVLPARFRLELENTSGGARAYSQIHVAVNSLNDPANFVARIEGESAAGGSSVADAGSSAGNRRSLTVNPTATLAATLNSTFAGDAQGGRFWLLARMEVTGTVTVRPELRSSGGTVVWRSHEAMQWTTATPRLTVLGTMPLPPGGWDNSWGALTLALVFTSDASVTVYVDYIAFLPAGGYQLITMLEESVADGSVVHIDGMDKIAGVMVGATRQPVASPRGDWMTLLPNTLQRIYVLQTLGLASNIGDTFAASVYYRPRRLTV